MTDKIKTTIVSCVSIGIINVLEQFVKALPILTDIVQFLIAVFTLIYLIVKIKYHGKTNSIKENRNKGKRPPKEGA